MKQTENSNIDRNSGLIHKIVLGLTVTISIVFVLFCWWVDLKSRGMSLGPLEILFLHKMNFTHFFVDTMPFITFFLVNLYFKFESQQKQLIIAQEQKEALINKNAEFAKKIGEGDYSTTLNEIDENDTLGKSLVLMRDNLLKNKTKENEENWIARGKESISHILRINDSIDELSYQVLATIINYTKLTQGAFYIYDESKNILENKATHAYGRKKYWKQTFKIGHGLIGQAAFEMNTIYRKEIPDDYTTVTSGILGDKKPSCLLIVPLIDNEKLHGVIEVASIESNISPLVIRFVEELSRIIARTIFNLKVTIRTSNLLHNAQQMTEELQEKQEKLRQSAEEMQATQEILEETNKNLELKILEVANSEKKLHTLLENASEVISIYAPDGTVLYESPAVKTILGYNSQDLVGSDGFSRVHETQEDMVRLTFARLLKNPDKIQRFDFKYTKPSGEVIWLESIGRNLLSNAAINGIMFNTRDITFHKLAEKEQRMRSRMQALSENSVDIIIRLGLEGELFYANPMFFKHTGMQPKQGELEYIYELDIDNILIKIFEEIIALIKCNAVNQSFEKNIPSMNGERIMLINAIPEYNDDKELETILVVAHDITEAKKIEMEIQEKNKKITESINYAYRIQSAILPNAKVVQRALPKSFIYYKPRDVVSGDFPWFFEKGDYAYISAVDCTGHGVPGALLSIIGYFILNSLVDHERTLTSGEILDLMHQKVRKTLKQDMEGSDARDGMDLAFCKINTKTLELEYSGAHRPLYLNRNGELHQFKGNAKAIGGIPIGKKPEKLFETHKIQLEKKDRIYFFSDGLPDQINKEKAKFSPNRIRELIVANNGTPILSQTSVFSNELDKWMIGINQVDDILLIGIEF